MIPGRRALDGGTFPMNANDYSPGDNGEHGHACRLLLARVADSGADKTGGKTLLLLSSCGHIEFTTSSLHVCIET